MSHVRGGCSEGGARELGGTGCTWVMWQVRWIFMVSARVKWMAKGVIMFSLGKGPRKWGETLRDPW